MAHSRILILALTFWVFSAIAGCAEYPASTNTLHIAAANIHKLRQMNFEPNVGQTDPTVNFLAQGAGYTLFLTPNQAVFALNQYSEDKKSSAPTHPASQNGAQQAALRMVLEHAQTPREIAGLDKQRGIVNYMIGSDKKDWHTNVPTYARVAYREVYHGIDLVYYGTQKNLEYDFEVKPQAKTDQIGLHFDGADTETIGSDGALNINVGGSVLQWHKPVIYQLVKGQKNNIPGRFLLKGKDTIGFQVGAYNHSLPLVIDPMLAYSTFLGGNTRIDYPQSIAVDIQGNAYITGYPGESCFPTTAAIFKLRDMRSFVCKIDPTGSEMLYTTYIGNFSTTGRAIAVDTDGDVYTTGVTVSRVKRDGTNECWVPTTPNALQPVGMHKGVDHDGYLVKLDPTGSSILYSTLLSGSKGGDAYKIALDRDRNVYITGVTRSTDFLGIPYKGPTATPMATTATPYIYRRYIAKLNPSQSGGNSLVYLKYFEATGGENSIGSTDLIVTRQNEAVIAGSTTNKDFPTTPNAYQARFLALPDPPDPNAARPPWQPWETPEDIPTSAFLAVLDSNGQRWEYATLWGGTTKTGALGVGQDAAGMIYVLGTAGVDMNTTVGAYQQSAISKTTGFLAKFDVHQSGGSSLIYSTYLGG